jgi:hypothetical protein
MWLTWGSTSSVCELAIRKVKINKAHEDFLISIDRLIAGPVVVLHGIAVRDLCSLSRKILGSKRIHEYEAIKRGISIVVIGHMMFRQRCNQIKSTIFPVSHAHQMFLVLLTNKTFHDRLGIKQSLAIFGSCPLNNVANLGCVTQEITTAYILDSIRVLT